MKPEQFAALAKLLQMRDGPARSAASKVLVDGLTVPEAARTVGMEYQAAHKAVKRARDGLELARSVFES